MTSIHLPSSGFSSQQTAFWTRCPPPPAFFTSGPPHDCDTVMQDVRADTAGATAVTMKMSTGPAEASSAGGGAVANVRTRRDRPCDACRRRKSRCEMPDGASECILCRFHHQDCTFVNSPQPRKRRNNSDAAEEQSRKRVGYVNLFIRCPCLHLGGAFLFEKTFPPLVVFCLNPSAFFSHKLFSSIQDIFEQHDR
jgi:hypothetical protein